MNRMSSTKFECALSPFFHSTCVKTILMTYVDFCGAGVVPLWPEVFLRRPRLVRESSSPCLAWTPSHQIQKSPQTLTWTGISRPSLSAPLPFPEMRREAVSHWCGDEATIDTGRYPSRRSRLRTPREGQIRRGRHQIRGRRYHRTLSSYSRNRRIAPNVL